MAEGGGWVGNKFYKYIYDEYNESTRGWCRTTTLPLFVFASIRQRSLHDTNTIKLLNYQGVIKIGGQADFVYKHSIISVRLLEFFFCFGTDHLFF